MTMSVRRISLTIKGIHTMEQCLINLAQWIVELYAPVNRTVGILFRFRCRHTQFQFRFAVSVRPFDFLWITGTDLSVNIFISVCVANLRFFHLDGIVACCSLRSTANYRLSVHLDCAKNVECQHILSTFIYILSNLFDQSVSPADNAWKKKHCFSSIEPASTPLQMYECQRTANERLKVALCVFLCPLFSYGVPGSSVWCLFSVFGEQCLAVVPSTLPSPLCLDFVARIEWMWSICRDLKQKHSHSTFTKRQRTTEISSGPIVRF